MLRDDGEVLAAWYSHLGVGYRKAYGDVHTAKTRLYTAAPGGGCITLRLTQAGGDRHAIDCQEGYAMLSAATSTGGLRWLKESG
jgi:hypothetical protein